MSNTYVSHNRMNVIKLGNTIIHTRPRLAPAENKNVAPRTNLADTSQTKPIEQNKLVPAVKPEDAVTRAIKNTALITCSYGNIDDVRRSAITRAITEWNDQLYIPEEGYFLEVVYPKSEPQWKDEDFPAWIKYIRIYGKERNRNIFQKEALWNIAAKMTRAEKMCFIDNDVMPINNKEWFLQLFNATVQGTVVHVGWKVIAEGEPNVVTRYSYMAEETNEEIKKSVKFPGLGYVLHRKDYEARDGFNPMSVPGSGDAIFLWESCPQLVYPVQNAKK